MLILNRPKVVQCDGVDMPMPRWNREENVFPDEVYYFAKRSEHREHRPPIGTGDDRVSGETLTLHMPYLGALGFTVGYSTRGRVLYTMSEAIPTAHLWTEVVHRPPDLGERYHDRWHPSLAHCAMRHLLLVVEAAGVMALPLMLGTHPRIGRCVSLLKDIWANVRGIPVSIPASGADIRDPSSC